MRLEVVRGFRQYDSRGCGPVAIVVHRVAGLDPDHRARVNRSVLLEATETTAQALAGPRDRTGHWRVPWPRRFGTSPWAAAQEMSLGTTDRYTWRVVNRRHLDTEFNRLAAMVDAGGRALLYVGNRWCPRHVITVLGRRNDSLIAFDPATGATTILTRDRFVARELKVSGWRVPWLVVEPVRRLNP